MIFRSHTPSDVEAMFQLDAVCFAEPFRFDRETMRQFAEEPGAIVIVVEDDAAEEVGGADLIAFMIVHLEDIAGGLYAYVVTIDVSPDHRRHGIGASMLDRAEAAARKVGATQMTLHVAAENHYAISFYKRQRFRRSGLVKNFYREAGQDAILFAKVLLPIIVPV